MKLNWIFLRSRGLRVPNQKTLYGKGMDISWNNTPGLKYISNLLACDGNTENPSLELLLAIKY